MKAPYLNMIRQGEYSAEFSIGTGSVPLVADHCVQDMIILPGSYVVHMAAILHRDIFKQTATLLNNIKFVSPVMLNAGDTNIRVDVCERERVVEYRFYEMAAGSDPRQVAGLEIPLTLQASANAASEFIDVDAFQAQSTEVLSSSAFYATLRENGNQYGLSFRNVASIWRRGEEFLGRLSGQHLLTDEARRGAFALLLDSATQMLARYSLERGKSFLLRAIDQIEFTGSSPSGPLWAHAERHPARAGKDEEVVGNVRIFDDTGRLWIRMSGVAIELLEWVRELTAGGTTIVVASNFTAEPVEDSLKFWADHFGMRVDVRFAPYNQLFQQLLDPESAFHKNADGANLILLSLEEWTDQKRRQMPHLEPRKAANYFAGKKRYILPNGLEIVHLNAYETDYVYEEIFADECYLRHDVDLPDGAAVIDIGANIGLFSLFVMSRCENPTIYAFEPAPKTFEVLKANCDAYGENIRAFNSGVSNKSGHAPFTFYENSSVFSGFHSDGEEDGKAVEAVVRNILNHASVEGDVDGYVRELSSNRIRPETHECSLTTVSEIIRNNQIETIDLLKIDAEKSELEILEGIDEADWKKIRQIVMEIHDSSGAIVAQIEGMLAARGYRCVVEEEKLLRGSGLVNLYAVRAEAQKEIGEREPLNDLERNVEDFCAALQTFKKQSAAPLVLCLCPRTPAANADSQRRTVLDAFEAKLRAEVATVGNVALISSAQLLDTYPVRHWHDSVTYQAGHVPFTAEGYAAIGTAAFRALTGLKRNPFKVIVLDCDNTLWKGVCGEDGPAGIEISKPFRELQEFMLAQMKEGMLLCLCSKNNEQDVLDVLDKRSDMTLRREHLATWRINWNAKSDNIRELAQELNLGLDSFIFVDDNPVECADLGINCPDVLTLQLPPDPAMFSQFLRHVWAFDRAGTTNEDQSRTRMYQQNAERERYREQTLSLKNFIEGLHLRIEINEATEQDIPRIAQLTQRTNQFNFTSVRRSEGEVRDFLRRDAARCLAVRVADRFGDYGLVGAVMYEAACDGFNVDTFLLSCRVLGRGVEHAVLRHVGQRAVQEDKSSIALAFKPNSKNLPAFEFLNNLQAEPSADREVWRASAQYLATLEYDAESSDGSQGQSSEVAKSGRTKLSNALSNTEALSYNEEAQDVAARLNNVAEILKAIEGFRLGTHTTASASPTEATTHTTLENIWKRVLGRSFIGRNDNFFEVGGTSLKAVQLVAMIRRELKQNLPVAAVFEYPTLSLMAGKLNSAEDVLPDKIAVAATLRGQQRRYKTQRNAG